MKNLIKLLAVAAPLALSVNANAATFALGSIGAGYDSGTLDFTNGSGALASFFDAAGGHFIDHIQFALSGSETVNITTTATATEFFINTGPALFTFVAGSSGIPPSFSGLLGAGNYQVDIKSDTGMFTANVNIAGGSVAAVPEPETYALMLAGLALVGFSARRRQA